MNSSGNSVTAETIPVALPKTRSDQIVGLDLVRFAAAVLVLMHHLFFWVTTVDGRVHSPIPLALFTSETWVGVQIFFVLSGFVIAFSANRSTAKKFLENRAVRLYPAAWVCSTLTLLCLYVVIKPHQITPLLRSWISSFLLLPARGYIDTVYWTLRVEIAFYAFVFFLLAFGKLQWLTKFLTAGATAYGVGWMLIFASKSDEWRPNTAIAMLERAYSFSPFSMKGTFHFLPFFAIGVLFYQIEYAGFTNLRGAAFLVCCIAAALQIHFHSLYLLGMQSHSVVPVSIWLLALAAIAVSIRWNATFVRLLAHRQIRALRIIGLMTYPLYLFHQVPGILFMTHLHEKLPYRISAFIAAALAIGISFFISQYVEQPMQALLRRVSLFRDSKLTIPTTSLP